MFSESILHDKFRQQLNRVIERVRDEIVPIKTGKASPSLVEGLLVNAYVDTPAMKLMELATITIGGANQLLIAPFDPTTTSAIEKAILTSPLHLTPQVEGHNIHISIPALTEEQRKLLLKTVSAKIEESRVAIRYARDDTRKKVRAGFENKEVTEDVRYRLEKEIDKVTSEYITLVEEMREKKEKEMLSL